MDRIDEAVEVANRVLCGYYDANTDDTKASPTDAMRAALLAGVKVLLGEPVACIHPDTMAMLSSDSRARHVKAERPSELNLLDGYIPLYAPSLGEGDGR